MTEVDPTPASMAVAEAPASGPGQLAAGDGVLVRIRSRLTEFPGALQRVAEQVLADPASAARATIVELAERSGTSPATVTRFCRALGFPGYAELRLGLAGETGWATDPGRVARSDHPLDTVLQQIMADDTGAMRDTAARLDLRAVATAADAIAAARRVDIYGASGSALVAGELQFCLHRIGVAAWSWMDIHDGLASAATLGRQDVVIGVSHTGESRATIEILAEAGSHGATTVALTSFSRSPLAGVADVVLLTAVQGTPFRPDALSARHPQLVVLDLLYIAVAQRLHDRADTAFQVTARAVDAHRAAKDGAGG